jgi:hypothetical protein
MSTFHSAFITLTLLFAILIIVSIIVGIIALLRNSYICKQQYRIIDAIKAYQMHCLVQKEKPVVNYTNMEPYEQTFNRFWDWGCTRILPKRKFAIIKQYLDAPKCFCDTIAIVKMGDKRKCATCKFANKCLTKKGNDNNARQF